jgi:hypothetical protein
MADRFGASFGKAAFLATLGAASWILFGTEQGRSAASGLLALAGPEVRHAPASVVSVPPSTRPASAGSNAVRSSPGVPASTTGNQVRSLASAEMGATDRSESAGTARAEPNPGVLSTRTALRASVSPNARIVELEAAVSASGARVTDGTVEFAVEGRVMGTAPVNSDGIARTRFTSLPSGVVRVTARYTGTGQFRESVGATYVSR